MNSKSTSPALQATALFRGMVILSVPPFQGINITSAQKICYTSFILLLTLSRTTEVRKTALLYTDAFSLILILILCTYIDTFSSNHGDQLPRLCCKTPHLNTLEQETDFFLTVNHTDALSKNNSVSY